MRTRALMILAVLLTPLVLMVPMVALAQVGELSGPETRSIGDWFALAAVVLGALVTAATAIAAVTPNTRDDEIVGSIKKIIDKFSVGGFNNMGGPAKK